MTVIPLNVDQQLSITVVVRRPTYNGMTIKDHADGIISGTHSTLSYTEFRDMFGATDADLDAVANFATAHSLTVEHRYRSGANLILTGTAGAFNSAFSISLNQVVTTDRTYHTYDGELVIPLELKDIVEQVLGLDTSVVFTHCATPYDPNAVGSPSSVPLTPQQVATAYNFPANNGAGTCVAIIELAGGYTQQNLTSSFSRIGITPNPTVVNAYGTNSPGSDSDFETMLDIYVIGGIVPKATIAMYFGNVYAPGFYNAVAAAVNDNIYSPKVISISWGGIESSGYMDDLFISARLKGITVTVATGDFGSKASANTNVYTVQYPASSPYVLACGGTTLQLNPNGTIANEFVWNGGSQGSAGGVSTLYSVPTWQTGLTSKKYPTPTVATLTSRGIPDVAGNGDPYTGYEFYLGLSNTLSQYGGTSAVAPLYAALFARIVALGGHEVGFINSVLYANPQVFQDITVGNNACPAPQGYSATPGWDACTGLGSPNGQAILNLLVSGQTKIKNNSGIWVATRSIKVKTGTSTWSNVTATYTKTNSGWILN